MLKAELQDALDRVIDSANIEVTTHQKKQLLQYAVLVALWDPKVDLTGAKTAPELADILFADVLNLLKLNWFREDFAFIDVGSGVGVPGVVLGIMRNDAEGYLIEPRKKRCTFLRLVAQNLELHRHIRIVEKRIDSLQPDQILENLKHAPTYALSRATFAPDQWLNLGRKMAPHVVVFATPQTEPEQSAIASYRYHLPHAGSERTLLLYER